jgi:hypothetical protein
LQIVENKGQEMKAILAPAAAAIVVSTATLAQNNFGEFVDMGATKVWKSEWESILPASYKGPATRGDAQIIFRKDGKLDGQYTLRPEGTSSKITGTWMMDSFGRLCLDQWFPAWSTGRKGCWYMYKLNGKYYGHETDSDPNAAVRKPLIPYETRVR